MEKSINKDMITDRSDNFGLKTNLSKNIQIDISRNSLLSSELGKKVTDKNNNNEVKQLNLVSEKSINKKIRKQLENDSLHSFDNFDNSHSTKKKINNNNIKKEKKELTKIIVDDIENIYSCLIDRSNKKYIMHNLFILTIVFLTNVCHWMFIFMAKTKIENNYCYTKMNQFDICSIDQICKNYVEQINLMLYNDTFEIHNNSLTRHQTFLEEMKLINEYYKTFFVSHNYQISKEKLLLPINMVKYNGDKINFAIILTKREKWNIYFQHYSVCHRDNSYFYVVLTIILGGFLGSLIFGLLADIYGRKKIIIILLFLVTISFSFISALSILLDYKHGYFQKEYEQKFGSLNQTDYEILSQLYSQLNVSKSLEKCFPKFLGSLFLVNLGLRPLGKICLALLLENSLSELHVLENFRRYTFATTGLPPLFAFLLLIVVNNFTSTMLIIFSFFILCTLLSFFLLNESMRYHYEYCEWKELTQEIMSLFKVTDDIPINYKNKIEFEAFKIEEFRKSLGNLAKKTNSIFDYIKQRIVSLNRDIRRNSSFIIKKHEIKFNPFIIYSCITANRVFCKLKYLMIIILIIIYAQVFFLEKELVEMPFFSLSDLFFDTSNNIFINSNFFILAIVTFISNHFFYLCYRISCFKYLFYFSLILVTFLLILYHFITIDSNDFPIDINQINFNMLEYGAKLNLGRSRNALLFFIHFFLNGINFYINILVLKLTKTLYRCTLFSINTILSLLSFTFGESLTYQIKHYFFLIGALNLVGIVSEFYFGELKGIPNIINDLKQSVNKENNKSREKSKKL